MKEVKEELPKGYIRCPNCLGTGEVPYKYVDFSSRQRVETFPCPKCRGKGYVKKEREKKE